MQACFKRRVTFGCILLSALLSSLALADSSETATNAQQIAMIKAQMNDAIERVKQIVNQPVTELRRTPDMHVFTYSGGWFHPGAALPNFHTVDVRATQVLPYNQYQYVTSDSNPGVVFLGSDLEFNSMTKYFYTDRSLPKKRLTESDMLEINQLYRVIWQCDHELLALENHNFDKVRLVPAPDNEPAQPPSLLATIHRWIFVHKLAAAGAVVALLAVLIFLRKRPVRDSAE